MSALFDVPGWSVPSAPVSNQHKSKKRKRAASSEEQDLLRSAQANLDKLINSFSDNAPPGDDAGEGSSKKRKRTKRSKTKSLPSQTNQHGEGPRSSSKPRSLTKAPSSDPPINSNKAALRKEKARQDTRHATQHTSISKPSAAQDAGGLTRLQRGFKKSLDGARFRLLNETLYKSDSHEALKMMKQDPNIFEDYHSGFRSQVQSWPSNPVSYYISELSSYPTKTVIADLGCGDAALARALLPKNLIVLSFDLVSDGTYVTEADICSRVPLPGSEPQSAKPNQSQGQVVDVVVCALSLMSTNWPGCIREAWRILRPGGELMVAEVASRFTSVDGFISLISTIGFKFEKKDDSNSYFTLFRFKKVARSVISEPEWTALLSRGRVLKTCEYKRR